MAPALIFTVCIDGAPVASHDDPTAAVEQASEYRQHGYPVPGGHHDPEVVTVLVTEAD